MAKKSINAHKALLHTHTHWMQTQQFKAPLRQSNCDRQECNLNLFPLTLKIPIAFSWSLSCPLKLIYQLSAEYWLETSFGLHTWLRSPSTSTIKWLGPESAHCEHVRAAWIPRERESHSTKRKHLWLSAALYYHSFLCVCSECLVCALPEEILRFPPVRLNWKHRQGITPPLRMHCE